MSLGVWIRLNSSVSGSHRIVLNLPASNCLRSLPDPATISTLPVRSSAAWSALTRMSSGTDSIDQCPARSL
jgi:hypothetical protein